MTPERRTNIILLTLLAILHLSTGMISRQLQGKEGWVIGFTTVIYLVIMFYIYWRFNRDGASLVQTLSYWGIVVAFLVTQRIAMVIDKTDVLGGSAIRALILVPIYFYIASSRDVE